MEGKTDHELVAGLVTSKGRPFEESLKGVSVRHEAGWVSGGAGASAGEVHSGSAEQDRLLCCACYALVADLLGHPAASGLLPAIEQGDAGVHPTLGNAFLNVFNACNSAFAQCFRAHLSDADGRLPLKVVNDFGKASLDLRRRWAWSVPNEPALAKLASLAPLIEIGAGTALWASLLRERGADIACYDSSAEWLSEFNAFEDGSQCAVPTTYTESIRGGPEAAGLPENEGRTLVLMWPDFMGRGTFGLEAVRSYTGPTLALIGEWVGDTYGVYATGLQPTGQSFSPLCQQYVERHFDLVERVALPNWPLFADCLRVYRRKAAAPEAAQPHTELRYSEEAGRYAVAAVDIKEKTELLSEEPFLRVVTNAVSAAQRGRKYVEMYEAARPNLLEFYSKGLQCHGDCAWFEGDVRNAVAEHDAAFADGGARASEMREVVQIASCYHYNGFGGVRAEGDTGDDAGDAAGESELSLRVFPAISFCNHSCAPNAVVAPNKGSLVSITPVPQGEPVTISYLEDEKMLASRDERRSFLRNRWGFTCGCTRCTLPYDCQQVFYHDGRTHPEAAPEAKRFAFTDEDGDEVCLEGTTAGTMLYSINGEPRPASRWIRFEEEGRELWFPDVDRCVTLPEGMPLQELYDLLGDFTLATGVRIEGLPIRPACLSCGSPFCAFYDGEEEGAPAVLRCDACQADVGASVAEALAGDVRRVEALLESEGVWCDADSRFAMRFALAQTRHHLGYRLLERLVDASPDDLTLRVALLEAAEALVGWAAGPSSCSALLADLHGDCAEVAFKVGEGDLATEHLNKQYALRSINEVVDPQFSHVADCQPNAQVMAFLYKD